MKEQNQHTISPGPALLTACALSITAPAVLATGDPAAPIVESPRATESLAMSVLAPDPTPASAQNTGAIEPLRKWRFEINSWAWLMGLEGDLGIGDKTADVSASFSDILDASDSLIALSGRLEVGYDRLGFFVDALYANIGADDQTGPLGRADVDITIEQWIVDFGMMFRIAEWKPTGSAAENPRNISLDAYAGARYISLTVELDPETLASRSRTREWVDPIVGAKFVLPIAASWHLSLNGDVGGFGVESDFTWSATGVIGYDFTLFGHPASVMAGYRAIAWDYSDGSGSDEFIFDILAHGPIIGFSIRF